MGFLWMVLGASIVIVGWNLIEWNSKRQESLKWWQLGIIALWGAALLLTVAFIGTAYGEGEPRAAMVGGVMFGLVVAISGVGLWRWLSEKKASPNKGQSVNG